MCCNPLWPAALVLTLVFLFHPGAAHGGEHRGNYVEGEVLVTFRPSVDLEQARETARRRSGELVRHFPLLSQRQGRIAGLVRVPQRTTAALIAEWKQDPRIETVEPNYLRSLHAMRPPNDPLFPQLWALRNTGQSVNGFFGQAGADIGFLAAWGMARPATGEVVVAVIDTGVDLAHPDLVPNLWTNAAEIPDNSLDDDGNGYVDDVVGYDFAGGTSDPGDSGWHGTHVAGTIAAAGNNAEGVIGVQFRARLMPLKASSTGTNLPTAAVIAATEYATLMKQRGVNVVAINASYGSDEFSTLERAAILAAGDAGIVFCASAGNATSNVDVSPQYPAAYDAPNVIAVAASDLGDQLASFSNYGATNVDLAAPGVSILSTIPLSSGLFAQVQVGSTVYSANPLTYSGITPGITGMIYDCDLGYPTNFPAAVSNHIALIRRGEIFFSTKVANAMAAGARAAIIYNREPGNFNGTLQSPGNWIPAVSLSQADGLAILATLPATGTVVVTPDPQAIYNFQNGTSMAAPHVAGAVAFAARCFPNETVTQRIGRILNHVTPLPALAGKTVTGGRLNLARVVDTDGNGLPDWWEQMYFGQLTGTNPNADADGDGQSNLAEWLAGTIPTNATSRLQLAVNRTTAPGGVGIEWPSAEGRYYRLLSATNPALLSASHLATNPGLAIRTNVAATPPRNAESDSLPPGTAARFYRVELEP